jgi:hypothetical protein
VRPAESATDNSRFSARPPSFPPLPLLSRGAFSFFAIVVSFENQRCLSESSFSSCLKFDLTFIVLRTLRYTHVIG